MSGLKTRLVWGVITLWATLPVWGDVAEVYIMLRQRVNGVDTVLREDIQADAGVRWTSPIAAPKIDGQLFTHWSLSTSQEYLPRDEWGRARDVAEFVPYENTVVTANYLPETEDADADGIPDGWEIYWYGMLEYDGAYDSDGDGLNFADELAQGTNPRFPDVKVSFKGISHNIGEIVLYNPESLQPYTFRSEPEGELFDTVVDYARPGQVLTVPEVNRNSSRFAYWTCNGARVADDWGRSLESVTFSMPREAVVYTAVCADDSDREKLYWYGRTDVADDSDTDGDGFTFVEEIAQGTNPLFPDARITYKGVVHSLGELIQYNPDKMQTYTFRSEPEGELFATVSDTVKAGTKLTLPTVDRANTRFAYWTCNGNRLTDEWGRSVDNGTVVMPAEEVVYTAVCADEADKEKLYWYGRTDIADDSDTDGDGFTFAEEIAQGTNPLFPDSSISYKGVVHAMTSLADMNLQVYDQSASVLVSGVLSELSFGFGITPVVVDLNDDGLFDIVILGDDDSRSVLMNVGTRGGPMFEEREWQSAWSEKVAAAQLTDISAFTLNEPIINPLSYTLTDDNNDGKQDLLASDTDGRIWCYEGDGENNFTLQHKVWGGSYAGFAVGLKISAVDWEDDGDWDLLCGTAEGKLFLIRDPRGGRPSNISLASGADSVSLSWDPSPQSRIRGYNVYRAKQDGEMEKLESTTIPKLLDKPGTLTDYRYQVTSFSRLYKTGNSKPITVESIPSEEVSASLGKVGFTWRPAAGFSGNEVAVDFAIDNAFHVAAENLTLKVAYDSAVLIPSKVITSGLTENFVFTQTKGNGTWLVSGTGGSINPGSGTFLTFVFIVGDQTQVADTKVTVEEFTLKSVGHENIVPILHNSSGGVTVEDDKPLDDSYVPAGSKGDLNGDGRLSWEDVELFLEWKDHPNEEVPSSIRAAGDFNGDGVMDNRDYGLLKAFYSQKAKNCPSLKGWDKNHGYKGVNK